MYGFALLSVAPIVVAAKPVEVYIMMGQSNCVGEGKIDGDSDGSLEFAVKNKGLYQYLVDENGDWKTFDTIRNVFIMGSGDKVPGRLQHNEWMTANVSAKPQGSNHKTLGLEFGIGHALREYSDAPVMILKSCIGNRALGWDLLPPKGEQFEYVDTKKNTTWIYAGYGESPARWEKGTTPQPITWHAGLQYDGDIGNAHYILDNLDTYYPGATDYKIAGFFWWQGDRDSRDDALASRYEHNLVYLIDALRSEFDTSAPFVTVSLGQSVKGDTNGAGKILDAMLAVDGNSGKYPQYKGNVVAVYSHPYSKGGSSGGHYNKNAETYMEVGQATGAAMVGLLKGSQISV